MKALQPFRWAMRKDGTLTLVVGNRKVIEIFERPHSGFCCLVFNRVGELVAREGYHSTFLPTMLQAVMWGLKKVRMLKILK